MGEHTPTPWASEGGVRLVDRCDSLWCGNILPAPTSKYRGEIARIQSADHIGGISIDEAAANAAFIVKACNSHDALVKALTSAQAAITSLPMEALGYASAENNQAHWPIRDELLHNISEALAKVGRDVETRTA